MARTEKAEGERDNDFVFIGYVETTLWACALDDLLQSDPTYVGRRDEDPGGRILGGLRWARNQGVHQLINLHEDRGGFTFPMSFPTRTTFEPVWLSRGEAAVSKARPQPDNEERYDSFVAGRSVGGTLEAAQDFLWMRALPSAPNPLPWLP